MTDEGFVDGDLGDDLGDQFVSTTDAENLITLSVPSDSESEKKDEDVC